MRDWLGGGPKISSASREMVESASWDQQSPPILKVVKEANHLGLKTAIMLGCLFPWLSDREDWLETLP